MSVEKAIYSNLGELQKLIEDYSKGRTIKATRNENDKYKAQREADFDNFSSIISGGDDARHLENKRRVKKLLTQMRLNEKRKAKSKQIENAKNQPKNQPKKRKVLPKKQKAPPKKQEITPKKQEILQEKTEDKLSDIIEFEEEEEDISNNNENKDLSIHRDNLQKIFNEWKTLDSKIEASLSPKSAKKCTPKEKTRSIENNSDLTPKKNKSSATPSKGSSQSSKSQDVKLYSAPSANTSNKSQECKVSTDEISIHSENSQKRSGSTASQPISNDPTNSTSSQVQVLEEATQTQLSDSPQHSNSYASSRNSSNSPHLVELDLNLHERGINLNENNSDDLPENEDNIILQNEEDEADEDVATSDNKEKGNSPNKDDPKLQEKPVEEEIVFETITTRSIKFNGKDENHDIEGSVPSNSTEDIYKNIEQSSSSSSDITIEAIDSSSDENKGQVNQSPIKTKVKKQAEIMEPIISSSESESEKKKQNQKKKPPQIIIPDSSLNTKKEKKKNAINTEEQDIIEILETSSSDSKKAYKPPNVVLSSSNTPKSAKTPELINPVFSSGSESKHSTDNEKDEKNSKEGKSVPIYSSVIPENNHQYNNYPELQEINQKIDDEIYLNHIQSSESSDSYRGQLSVGSNEDNDKDLPLLQTTDSESDDY